MYQMTFVVTITPDDLCHVQNVVGGMSGQHHVHTAESFARWRRPGDDVRMGRGECDCDLGAGDVRDHTGKVSHNKEFE